MQSLSWQYGPMTVYGFKWNVNWQLLLWNLEQIFMMPNDDQFEQSSMSTSSRWSFRLWHFVHGFDNPLAFSLVPPWGWFYVKCLENFWIDCHLFGTDIHDLLRIICNNVGDPLTHHLASLLGQNFNSSNMSNTIPARNSHQPHSVLCAN